MSQYYRNHPDEPVSHDWFAGAKRCSINDTVVMVSPVFLRVDDSTTWVQIHAPAHRKKLKDAVECRRVSYSVAGAWLEVWEVKRTPAWVGKTLAAPFPDCREVWGGDHE